MEEERMIRMRMWLAISALLAAIPAAAAAQATASAQPAAPAPELVQRSFVYLGHDLRVTILGEAAGTIRVMRGEAGRLDLNGRVVGGLVTTGLEDGSPSELTLASGGASRVDWVLVVPRDVRLSLRLRGQPAATLGTLAPAATWNWAAQPSAITPLPTP
jgi:hypothetical protein